MLKSVDFYIDLGTENTLIYAKSRGFQLNEPSVMAVKQRYENDSELFALGQPAKALLGKVPSTSAVLRPLREGVISDFDDAAKMLNAFVKRIRQNIFWFKPRLIISLPCKVSEHERRAVQELGKSLGAGKVYLVTEPMAAAIGAGLPVLDHKGQMIVDIGGGTSEVAILSLGGVISANAVRIGGNSLDEDIISHLKNKHSFLIGEQSAEMVKKKIARASVKNLHNVESIDVGGIDLNTLLPRKKLITSDMILEPVENFVNNIIAEIIKTFEDCPPEVAGDIAENGICITGGGALIGGLAPKIAQVIGVPARICNDPLLSVANGGARLLEENSLFDRIQTA